MPRYKLIIEYDGTPFSGWQWQDEHPSVQRVLTDAFAMHPAAAVSGFYLAHPQARYFAVGKVERDQVGDYAHRKGMDLAHAERWLASILNY